MMKMNKLEIVSLGLSVLGAAVTLASSLVEGKLLDAKVADEVAHQLELALEKK